MFTLCMFSSECPRVGVYDRENHYQTVEINLNKIFGVRDAYHTLFHVLGRHHEHQRPDRDQYITVHWNNIKRGTVYSVHVFLYTHASPYFPESFTMHKYIVCIHLHFISSVTPR